MVQSTNKRQNIFYIEDNSSEIMLTYKWRRYMMKSLWEDLFTCQNYYQIRKSMFKEEEQFLNYILQDLNENVDIIDLCCGGGLHAQYFSTKYNHVTAIDNSKVMIDIATKNCTGKITFLHNDIETVRISTKFDLATFFYGSLIFNTPKIRIILSNVSNHVKKGGKLIIDNRNFSTMYNLIGNNFWVKRNNHVELQEFYINPISNIITTKTHYLFENKENYTVLLEARYYTLAELNEFLKEAGFTIEKFFGDYSLHPYRYKSSPRLIIVARKGV